jgi:hypothetical protein
MKREKIVVYGPGLFDVKTGKDIDFHVTSIIFKKNNMIEIVFENHKTLKVHRIEISVEHAQDIGFINFYALGQYFEKINNEMKI